MDRLHRRDDGDVGARHAGERDDLARIAHADLVDGVLVSSGVRTSVSGTPQWLL